MRHDATQVPRLWSANRGEARSGIAIPEMLVVVTSS
jgi:hypothetical protein